MSEKEWKVLHIDLTEGKHWTETLDEEVFERYLGCRGIQAELLWDEVGPDVDPLSPKNVLIFGTGTLTGTPFPSTGRTTITFKSPATGAYGKTNVGGYYGLAQKVTGYDSIMIHGKADSPVYIKIDGGSVSIEDAETLWGKNTRETYKKLKENGELSYGYDFACIGPAGENLVKFASIMISVHNAAARGGPGAVMGSKNLKALVVGGKNDVSATNLEEFMELLEETRERVWKDEGVQGLRAFGTSGSLPMVNELYCLPTKNFTDHFDEVNEHAGEHLTEAGYLENGVGCGSCPVSCHRHTTVEEGKYAGTDTVGPEYETMSAFGTGCDIDIKSTIKANDLSNILGLDTISAGTVIQWAMESYEKGVITEEDTDGLDLSWGNDEAVMELLEKIAHRKGFGDVLARGVKEASEIIGGDSWKWAIQAKGLEQSRVETRVAKAYALAFAVNPRGPDHLHTETFAEFGAGEDAKDVIEKITGDRDLAVAGLTEGRPEIVRWHEDVYAITDSIGLCAFQSTAGYAYTPELMTEIINAKTGMDLTKDDVMKAGRRTINTERCFNVREGMDRANDTLPWRMMNETTEGSPLGTPLKTPEEELEKMLDKYYELHGWNENGIPTEEVLDELGLQKFKEKA